MANLIGTAPNQVPTNGSLGTMAFQDKESVVMDRAETGILKGKLYKQTSTDGVNTSIVDTGITYTGDEMSFGRGGIYDVYVVGTPSPGGNVGSSVVVATFFIDINYSVDNWYHTVTFVSNTQSPYNPLTLSVVFWDGSSEVAKIDDGTNDAELRIKVAGYQSAYIGYEQQVRIIKRL